MISGLKGKVRRLWLSLFRRRYVRAQRARRRGACRCCGKCCRFGCKCLFLTSDNLCKIHSLPRPLNCRVFPIDERDLAEVGFDCGFYFVEEPGPEAPELAPVPARAEAAE